MPKDIHSASRGETYKKKILDNYALEEGELIQLEEIADTIDIIEALKAHVQEVGHTVAGRVNPSIVELRQQRIALMRLIGALGLPALDEETTPRYVRTGTRGPYKTVKGA
jgi:hypothetical protein